MVSGTDFSNGKTSKFTHLDGRLHCAECFIAAHHFFQSYDFYIASLFDFSRRSFNFY